MSLFIIHHYWEFKIIFHGRFSCLVLFYIENTWSATDCGCKSNTSLHTSTHLARSCVVFNQSRGFTLSTTPYAATIQSANSVFNSARRVESKKGNIWVNQYLKLWPKLIDFIWEIQSFCCIIWVCVKKLLPEVAVGRGYHVLASLKVFYEALPCARSSVTASTFRWCAKVVWAYILLSF